MIKNFPPAMPYMIQGNFLALLLHKPYYHTATSLSSIHHFTILKQKRWTPTSCRRQRPRETSTWKWCEKCNLWFPKLFLKTTIILQQTYCGSRCGGGHALVETDRVKLFLEFPSKRYSFLFVVKPRPWNCQSCCFCFCCCCCCWDDFKFIFFWSR